MNNSNNLQNVSQVSNRSLDLWDISLFILFGISLVDNSLIMIVMRNKRMKHTNGALFLSLMAFMDVTVLFFRLLANVFKIYKVKVYYGCIFIQYVLPETTAMISYWLIIIISFERCCAVLYPLQVAAIFSRKRCYIIISSMILLFIIIPNTQSICLTYSKNKPYYCDIKGDKNGTCFNYIKNIYPSIRSAIMSWIPSVLGVALNTIIIVSLFKSSKKRAEICMRVKNTINKNKKFHFLKENQITITLCIISVSFVVLTLPFSVFELLRKNGLINTKDVNTRRIQRFVMILLEILHSINFFYCLTGKKFRDSLKELCYRNEPHRHRV